MSKKHALIVGINRYPFWSADQQLSGCVKDAELIRKTLIQKFYFDPSDIVTCYDEAATRDGIHAQLDRLAANIEQDDIVVFHYSGHGALCNTHSDHSAEGSGKNNCIVPHDDSEPSAENKPIYREITDKQFNDWLQKLAIKTRYTTLIFDCCNSGTMTRSKNDNAQARMLPSAARLLSSSSADSNPDTMNTAPKAGAGAWLSLSDNYVVISACRDRQQAKEKSIIVDGETVRHGMLTYHLTQALSHARPGTTYRDIFEPTCAGVISQVKAQNPQIEGAIDREIFGIKDIEPLRYIPVKTVDGDTLVLDGGAAQGLRRGSKWSIYPPGTKQEDITEKLGCLTINQVGALSSTAIVNEITGSIVAGARCIETEPVESPEPLLVDLSSIGVGYKATLEPAIRRSKLVAVADTETSADIRAKIILRPEDLAGHASAKDKSSFAGPSWAFYEDGNELCMPLHQVDEPSVSSLLLNNLEKIARFRNVLQLDNSNPNINVSFNIFKRNPEGKLILANGGNTAFGEGDPIVLEITNNENEQPVFFSILWLSANREIIQFYPYRKACEELSPGKTIRFPPGTKPLTAELAEDYPYNVGSETCKAIFSTRETDFRWLNQGATRSGNVEKASIPAVDASLNGSAASTSVSDNTNDHTLTSTALAEAWDAIGRTIILTRVNKGSQL